MAKQEFEQGDSNVVVRNQVVYGALPQDVIDRMGDTTLNLLTNEQTVIPAINELKSNLNDLIQFETQTVNSREWNIIKIPNVGAIAFWYGGIMVTYGTNGANVQPNIPQIQGYTVNTHSVNIAQNATPGVYLAYCNIKSSTQLDFYARGLTSGSGYLYTSIVIYYKANS